MPCRKDGKKSSQNFSRISYEGTCGTELPIHCEAMKKTTLACNILLGEWIHLEQKKGFPSSLVSLHMQLFFISFSFCIQCRLFFSAYISVLFTTVYSTLKYMYQNIIFAFYNNYYNKKLHLAYFSANLRIQNLISNWP
jgi:hypothetical protein